MKNISYILLCLLGFTSINGQQTDTSGDKGHFNNLELTLNFAEDAFVPSIAYQRYFAIGKNNRLFIGPGIRFYGISSNERWRFAETNAPEDNFNDGDRNVNAFFADETRIAALNLGLYISYRIGKFEIGTNTDVIGFSISESISGDFQEISTGNLIPVSGITSETLTLFPFNGSYNTEIVWAGYRIGPKSLIKVGITFTDFKYELTNEDVPSVALSEEKYERIHTNFTIGYNYRF